MSKYMSIGEKTFVDGQSSLIKLGNYSCRSFFDLSNPSNYYISNFYLNPLQVCEKKKKKLSVLLIPSLALEKN